MSISNEEAIRRYTMIRNELCTQFPEIWNEVVALCEAVPDQIDIESVWLFGRDKPCWSNIKVNAGRRIASDIPNTPDFSSFNTIAGDTWKIVMRTRGRRWTANENFGLQGEAVRAFIGGLERGGLSSYLWKLFAIRNLAIALEGDPIVREMVNNLSVQGGIPPNELKQWTKTFSKRVGMGWGVVTVYHMLTDLGLTPKPDRQLKRSVIRMGLLAPEIPSDCAEELFDKVDDHVIVLTVMELSNLLTPTAIPQKPRSTLREVDKVLMEWSRQGLSRPL